MGFVIPVGIKEPFEKLPTGYIVFNIDKISEGFFSPLPVIFHKS